MRTKIKISRRIFHEVIDLKYLSSSQNRLTLKIYTGVEFRDYVYVTAVKQVTR